jgi:hypothetical protein
MGKLRQTLQKYLHNFFCENRFSQQKTRFSLKSDRESANFPTPNCENRVFADYNSENQENISQKSGVCG